MFNLKVLVVVISAIYLLSSSKGGVKADFADNNSKFAVKFFNQIISDPNLQDRDVAFSPFSIQTAGGLLYAGAEADTAKEILDGFMLPGTDKSSVSDAFANYLQSKKELLSSGQLNIANKIFLMNGYTLKPTFKDIAINSYSSDVENINFSDANAAKHINDWVEEHTNGKIKNMVEANSLSETTRMYLINAIHFKGEWADKFDPKNTQPGDFNITPKRKISVDMMSRTGDMETKRYHDISARAVNLKFANSDLSLFLLWSLNSGTPLKELKDKLSDVNLVELFGQVFQDEISLTMPKFKIDFEIDLKNALKGLNMDNMFDDNKADFSSLLTNVETLAVSEAVHKVSIEINEEGGEASAATGLGIQSRMGPSTIIINSPFLYFIKSSDGTIYFMGQYTGE